MSQLVLTKIDYCAPWNSIINGALLKGKIDYNMHIFI